MAPPAEGDVKFAKVGGRIDSWMGRVGGKRREVPAPTPRKTGYVVVNCGAL